MKNDQNKDVGDVREKRRPFTRKSSPSIKVYCFPEEKALIAQNARTAGKSISAFLLAVGQGSTLHGIVDYENVRQLAKVNGDLARLTNVLQLWLSDDFRTAAFDTNIIRRLLQRIDETQDELTRIMKIMTRSRSLL